MLRESLLTNASISLVLRYFFSFLPLCMFARRVVLLWLIASGANLT